MRTATVSKQTLYIFEGTFRHAQAGFIIDRQARGLAKGTIKYYMDELDRFAEFQDLIGVLTIEEVTADVIRKYTLQLGQTRNKGGVHAAYRAIRALLLWYEGEFEPEGWKNPVHKVKIAHPRKQAKPGVTLDDIQTLIDACERGQAIRDRAILLCLVDCGARASEFIALKVRDVDLMTGAVHIEHGKGDKRRTVFLGAKSRKALRRYLKERVNLEPGSPLFASFMGEPLKYNGLVSIIRERAKKARIKRPGLHDFRRAFAVQMLRGGCDLARLAEMMGHSSLEVLRVYLHLVTDDLRQAHIMAGPVDHSGIG